MICLLDRFDRNRIHRLIHRSIIYRAVRLFDHLLSIQHSRLYHYVGLFLPFCLVILSNLVVCCLHPAIFMSLWLCYTLVQSILNVCIDIDHSVDVLHILFLDWLQNACSFHTFLLLNHRRHTFRIIYAVLSIL